MITLFQGFLISLERYLFHVTLRKSYQSIELIYLNLNFYLTFYSLHKENYQNEDDATLVQVDFIHNYANYIYIFLLIFHGIFYLLYLFGFFYDFIFLDLTLFEL